MGSEQQETKSLPRNRKCGNCRFFEPAPLWRKGWCRNPQLYPPHANHLVDSTSIDCEGGFRSRIYWEPLPVAETSTAPVASIGTAPITPRIYQVGTDAADSGQEMVVENAFSEPPPLPQTPPQREPGDEEFFGVAPVDEKPIVVEAQTGADEEVEATEITPAESNWHGEVRRLLPFTRTWPLERINLREMLPWVAVGLLVIILAIVLLGGKDKTKDSSTEPTSSSAVATQNAQFSDPGTKASPTLAPALRTSVTVSAGVTTTVSGLIGKQGTVAGLGGDVLRLRAQPSTTSEILDKLKEGDKVKILEGPLSADQLEWYKVEANRKVGWLVKKYVTVP